MIDRPIAPGAPILPDLPNLTANLFDVSSGARYYLLSRLAWRGGAPLRRRPAALRTLKGLMRYEFRRRYRSNSRFFGRSIRQSKPILARVWASAIFALNPSV